MISKLAHVVSTAGVAALPWRLYSYVYKNYVRPVLPSTAPIILNGVTSCHNRKVGDAHLGSLYRPLDVVDNPLYESGLGSALRTHVRPGDRITIVGGGSGVTVVIAAQCASPGGSVVCFEGDRRGVANVHRTARLNGVADRVSVTHAIVGQNVRVYNDTGSTRVMSAAALPDCDLLELDCEGAESTILRTMTITPRVVVVETHGFLGSSTQDIRELLTDRGYSVTQVGVAEARMPDDCLRKDVMILVGTRSDAARPN